MKKQILSILTLVGLFISPISCSVFNNLNSNSGTIKMAVKFPENNGFSIKAIPDNTYVIIVQINGVGVDSSSPIFFSLTRNENSRLIRNIPEGDKNIKVLALASNAELYQFKYIIYQYKVIKLRCSS